MTPAESRRLAASVIGTVTAVTPEQAIVLVGERVRQCERSGCQRWFRIDNGIGTCQKCRYAGWASVRDLALLVGCSTQTLLKRVGADPARYGAEKVQKFDRRQFRGHSVWVISPKGAQLLVKELRDAE